MTRNTGSHPVFELRQSSQVLQERSLFAHRQAATGAERARKASEALAELDLEKAFRQLRQMVKIVGGKSASDSASTAPMTSTNVVSFPGQGLAKAAE